MQSLFFIMLICLNINNSFVNHIKILKIGFCVFKQINNIKLPRNDNGRNKGFGYVEFEERKELITALGMENLVSFKMYCLK